MHAPRCQTYLCMNDQNLPTGEMSSVINTQYDFRAPTLLDREDSTFQGYDNFFVLSQSTEQETSVKHVVTIVAPTEDDLAVQLVVCSNQPGFQVYTANGFDGSGDGSFAKFGSIAIEPNWFVDAPNHENFGSIELHPGMTRKQITQFKINRVPYRDALKDLERASPTLQPI